MKHLGECRAADSSCREGLLYCCVQAEICQLSSVELPSMCVCAGEYDVKVRRTAMISDNWFVFTPHSSLPLSQLSQRTVSSDWEPEWREGAACVRSGEKLVRKLSVCNTIHHSRSGIWTIICSLETGEHSNKTPINLFQLLRHLQIILQQVKTKNLVESKQDNTVYNKTKDNSLVI